MKTNLTAAMESAERIVKWCAERVGDNAAFIQCHPHQEGRYDWEIEDLCSAKAEQVEALQQAGLAQHTAERLCNEWWAEAHWKGFSEYLCAGFEE